MARFDDTPARVRKMKWNARTGKMEPPPSRKQLEFARDLTARAGEVWEAPATGPEAAVMIDRLLRAKRSQDRLRTRAAAARKGSGS